MSLRLTLAAAALALTTAPALADIYVIGPDGQTYQTAPTYAYGGPNYCPAGTQPIVLGGVICCGTPTRSGSYQDMMRHPVSRSTQARRTYPTIYDNPGIKGTGG